MDPKTQRHNMVSQFAEVIKDNLGYTSDLDNWLAGEAYYNLYIQYEKINNMLWQEYGENKVTLNMEYLHDALRQSITLAEKFNKTAWDENLHSNDTLFMMEYLEFLKAIGEASNHIKYG